MSKTNRGVCANCHTVFEVSKKTKKKNQRRKISFLFRNLFLEKYGKTKITISEIPLSMTENI